MGVSKWSSEYQLWCEKLDLLPPKEENDAMRRGKELESIARETAEKKLGIRLMPGVFVKDFQIASLDGICQKNKVMIEIKCPGKIDHEMGMDGVVPEHYYPQLQHQMMVLDIPSMYYLTYNEYSNNLFEVKRDSLYCEKLLEKEKKFWYYLQTLESPPLTDKDYYEMTDIEWLEKAKEWHRINKQLKNFEEIEDKLRKELIALSNGRNCKGAGVKISSSIRKGNVDYKSIPVLENIDLEKYRKPKTVVWRLGEI
jgi:putative phage-type endonuclease